MTVVCGDCLDVMQGMEPNSIDTIITDPPYGLAFMGKQWDHGVPGVPFWEAALRVAKPGAMLLAFGGTRTHHRLMCAIEDAGWEVRDCMMWLYGSGFPKSLNISKAFDKKAGADRPVVKTTASGGYKRLMTHNAEEGFRPDDYYPEGNKFTSNDPITDLAKLWNGWGTALKPAWEPIILAMKPCEGTFVDNAEKYGVAGLNIDGCRVEYQSEADKASATPQGACTSKPKGTLAAEPDAERSLDRGGFDRPELLGRFPANVILDEEAGGLMDKQTGTLTSGKAKAGGHSRNLPPKEGIYGGGKGLWSEAGDAGQLYGDSGGASRFFYCAKAPKSERGPGNNHPTVKPLALMRYLAKLTATPTGGLILDPFAGSGTTGVAAVLEGRDYYLIEKEESYCEIARQRIAAVEKSVPATLFN